MMTRSLAISTDLALPLDDGPAGHGAIVQKNAFLGRTGSGKSYAATKLAELMLEAGAQIVALDPVGVWPFLRLGDRPFDLPVLGGLYGDVPLEATGGALVADFIVDTGTSAVLDLSQFTDSDARRFATAFADRFFQRKKAAPSPVHIFLEECQEFVPQESRGDVARMLNVFERLIKLGRNFKIGVSLISQRPQEVNKKALNQTECLYAFQMTGPQERKAIAAWTKDKGLDVDIDSILPKLAVGHCHVWSPQWLGVSKQIRIAKKRTLDAAHAPAVKGTGRVQLSPVNLPKLREAMSETVERAKADDPKALRATIAELRKELGKKESPKPERVEVPVVDAATVEAIEKIQPAINQARMALDGMIDATRIISGALSGAEALAKAARTQATKAKPSLLVPPSAFAGAPKVRHVKSLDEMRAPVAHRDPKPSNSAHDGPGVVGKGMLRKILTVLAQRPQGLLDSQIGARALVSSKGGTYSNNLGIGRKNGWIVDEGKIRKITDAGLEALGRFDPLPEGADLLEHWLRELGDCMAAKILRAVADAYPERITFEEIGAAANVAHTGGTFSNNVGRLRSLELVTGERGSGTLLLSEELAG